MRLAIGVDNGVDLRELLNLQYRLFSRLEAFSQEGYKVFLFRRAQLTLRLTYRRACIL